MGFSRSLPSAVLSPYISSYMVGEDSSGGVHKVIPRPFSVMGIQYRGEMWVVEDDRERKLTASGITGLNDTCRTYRTAAGTGTVLIEFTPHGAAKFFGFPLDLIFGGSFSLEELTHRRLASELEEKMAGAENNNLRISVLEQFFLSRLQTGTTDILVEEAVKRIQLSRGTMRIAELAASLGISQRQFEKRFLRVIGSSPKKFSSLTRLHTALKHHHNGASLTQLALDTGYYDQAHFIKDFKSYTGLTPEQFFSDTSRE